MIKSITTVVMGLLISTTSFAVDDTYWKIFDFDKTSADSVEMIFGAPDTIKTDEKYIDFKKHQEAGCGQINIYAFHYSSERGDLNVLKGPLGKASEAYIFIEKNKVYAIEWKYKNLFKDSAYNEWMKSSRFSKLKGKDAVIILGVWKPNDNGVMFVECFTGKVSNKCDGEITVGYSRDYKDK